MRTMTFKEADVVSGGQSDALPVSEVMVGVDLLLSPRCLLLRP